MELVAVLRTLARRRLLLALGLLLSVGVGALASGALGQGPGTTPELRTAAATTAVQIDTARPIVGDLRANNTSIGTQAILLGEHLAGARSRRILARAAGIPVRDLTVVATRSEEPFRPSPLAIAAGEAAESAGTPFRVTATTRPDAPVIAIRADAPTARQARQLARGVAPALEAAVRAYEVIDFYRLRVRPLGGLQVRQVVDGGPSPAKGAAGGLGFFVAWCCGLVLATGIGRVWRDAAAPPLEA